MNADQKEKVIMKLALMQHDLLTHLQTVRGTGQVLEKMMDDEIEPLENKDELMRQFVHQMRDSADKGFELLTDQVREIIDFLRIDDAKI